MTEGGRTSSGDAVLMGDHVSRQVRVLSEVAGIAGETVWATLAEALGPLVRLPLPGPPPARTFLSDDHSPVEFSLAFTSGMPPILRVLLEPGCTEDMVQSGRIGRQAIEGLADRGILSCDRLRRLADLFFPAAPCGPFALWLALEFPAGRPRAKVYLNPAANGAAHSADTVAEALARLGHGEEFSTLRRHGAARFPDDDALAFFALDLGAWPTPRAKVYVAHRDFCAADAAGVSRAMHGNHAGRVEEFVRLIAGDRHLQRRPVISCFSYTHESPDRPSGYTVHVPIRDYVHNDRQARNRAAAALRRHGIGGEALDRALTGLTSRALDDGVGLIAYLALTHAARHRPRVTAYLSSEAYKVQPARPNAEGAARLDSALIEG